MFDRITSGDHLPLEGNDVPSGALIRSRLKVMNEVVRELAKQAKVSPTVIAELVVRRYADIFEMVPSASNKGVNLPPLLLFNLNKDFGPGSEFNIKDLQDLDNKLKDPEWLQRFSNKLCDMMNIAHVVVGIEERESLRLLVRYLEGNEADLVNGCRFAILHELGHLEHKHEEDFSHHTKHDRRWVVAGGLTAATLTFIVAFVLSATVLGFLIAVPVAFVVGCLAVKIFQELRNIEHSKEHERQADLYGATALEGQAGEDVRKGAIYFFETIKKHQYELRNNPDLPRKERMLFRLVFSPEGHDRNFYFTHDNESERIAKLRELQSKKESE